MASDQTIVRAAIAPGIGIARVGNSPDAFFIGPELPYPVAAPRGGYKDGHSDPTGALKRQAARFRIYGYAADGSLVRELTADDAEITWSVHLANKKAAWYSFEVALDMPDAPPSPRRNPAVLGEQRQKLVIDPGPRTVTGPHQDGSTARFDTGMFWGRPVYLGELRTDAHGRLLVLGGHGVADTAFAHNPPTSFANNVGWYDDIADGPVEAMVRIAGKEIPVDPAWVVVAPPNYAPDMQGVLTLYDVLYDTYQDQWLSLDPKPSFTRQIAPLLLRMCMQQWVNYGFHIQFGPGGPHDFTRPELWARLASNRPEHQELRRQIYHMFRNPASKTLDIDAWPLMYGDNMGGAAEDPRQMLAVTNSQYQYLRAWVRGVFEADWETRDRTPPRQIEDVPLAEQPATLDQAALSYCLGGPFHPGCELTWPMRHVTMYRAPFRVRPRSHGQPEIDYGDMLTSADLDGERGPLYANGPGDLTRWMAVPWHTDTASCQAGYDSAYDPYLPTFWPARVPNHVLRTQDYTRLMDASLPIEERLLAFNTRASWPRGLDGEYLDQIAAMVHGFGKLGVLERHPGPSDLPGVPAQVYVESDVGYPDPDDTEEAMRKQVRVGADTLRRRRRRTTNPAVQPRSKR